MKHLWEVNHAYYCNLGNYYSNGCGHSYESFRDFMSEWGNTDMDYNLLFRWDWKCENLDDDESPTGYDSLEIFWMLQRKGAYLFCEIKVTKKDEQAVIDFLIPRWEYMKSLWEPFGL